MNTVSYDEVINNIRFFMNGKWKGFKQTAIAERAGFDEKQFSNMLNGRRKIQVHDIAKIAAALGVTPNDLLLLREPPGKDSQPKATKVS